MNTQTVKFNPTVEKLTSAVAISKKIVVKDLRDLKQIALVRETRKELRSFEIVIEKDGKAFRQEARDYATEVIRQEKELKKITTPEIERLKAIEDKSEAILLEDRRLKSLPDKKERLEAIGDNVEIGDDYLLGLDDLEFVAYLNQRVSDKNEADREALRIEKKEAQNKIDEANRKLKADKLKLQHQKELQEADKRAKEELAEKVEADRLKAIEDKKLEDEKLAKRKAYIEFLKENGYTEKEKENYHIEKSETKMVLYKKIGEFKI